MDTPISPKCLAQHFSHNILTQLLPTGQSLLFIVFASESYSGVGSEKGYADS
jgi:hypothetical protein